MAEEKDKAAQDVQEQLFEAINVIAGARISELDFNKTIICTIEDVTNAERGEYTVSQDGKISFKAYSENTKYSVGTSVYVLIPNDDFTQQKLITGKYIPSENDEYYTYVKPSESYVNITENLIKGRTAKSLLANGEDREVVIAEASISEGMFAYDRLCVKADFQARLAALGATKGDYGIRIDVQYKLPQNSANSDKILTKEFYLKSDSFYGNPYNYTSYYNQEAVFDIADLGYITNIKALFYQKKNFKDKNEDYIPAYLDAEGNVLFSKDGAAVILPDNLLCQNLDISLGYDYSNFKEDTLLLYTLNGETYTDDNTAPGYVNRNKTLQLRWIRVEADSVYAISKNEMIPGSAKIHWYHYRLADDVLDPLAGAFWEEIPFANNADKFKYTAVPAHGVPKEQYKVIVECPSKEYLVTQVYKDPGDKPLPDSYVSINKTESERLKLEYVDDLEEIKNKIVAVNNNSELTADEKTAEKAIYEAQFDERLNEIKGTYSTLSSKILVLSNEKAVADQATVSLIRGLEIICEGEYEKTTDTVPSLGRTYYIKNGDAYEVAIDVKDFANGTDYYTIKNNGGIYKLYDETGEIRNVTDSTKMRKLEAMYTTLITGEMNLDTAEKICWKIPINNTMIYEPEDGKEFNSEEDIVKKDNDFIYIERHRKDNPNGGVENLQKQLDEELKTLAGLLEDAYNKKYTEIQNKYKELFADHAGTLFPQKVSQEFRIKKLYNQNCNNNTIYCTIVKNNVEYVASIDLFFGPNGTSGTNYTFNIELEKQTPCITKGDSTPIKIIPTLFDYENKEIDLTGTKITYKWYCKDTPAQNEANKILFCNKDGVAYSGDSQTIAGDIYIKYNLGDPQYYILQASVAEKIESLGNTVDLTVCLPIAYRTSNTISEYVGVTKIVYDSSGGKCSYYTDPCKLYNNNRQQLTVSSWSVETEDVAKQFYPTIEENQKDIVTAAPMYYQGNKKQVCVKGQTSSGAIWYQPLLISQNAYGSAMLNNWNGKLQIDEENGTIMAPMVGAGKKDSQNRFEGVLMGDVKTGAGDKAITTTGLYGFNEGAQSFGFLIDGTAFIGKSGKGQIRLDGNKGTIQSGSYTKNSGGMQIDLDGDSADKTCASLFAYGPGGAFELNTNGTSSLLVIRSGAASNATKLLCIGAPKSDGTREFYLQTDNFSTTVIKDEKDQTVSYGSGVKLDLKNGKLTGYDFNLLSKSSTTGSYININSSGAPYLRIFHSQTGDNAWSGNIFEASTSSYYLQSIGYESGEEGVKFDLKNGKLDAYNFSIKATDTKDNSQYKGSYIQLSSGGNPYLKVQYVNTSESRNITLLNITSSEFLLKSRDFKDSTPDKEWFGTYFNVGSGNLYMYANDGSGSYIQIKSSSAPFFNIYYKENKDDTNGKSLIKIGGSDFYLQTKDYDTTNKTGLRFDLKSGKLTGYNFDLKTYSSDGKKYIRIYSGDSTYPLRIENTTNSSSTKYVRCTWNGKLEANDVDITGAITATSGSFSGTISAAAGSTFGPWTIGDSAIYRTSSTYGASNGMYFGTSGLSLGSAFKVSSSGALTASSVNISGSGTGTSFSLNNGVLNASGAVISGQITAGSGSIGPWTIGSTAIFKDATEADNAYNTSGAMYFGDSGVSISTDFRVTAAGKLYAKNAEVTGTIKAEYIVAKENLKMVGGSGRFGAGEIDVLTATDGDTTPEGMAQINLWVGNNYGVDNCNLYSNGWVQVYDRPFRVHFPGGRYSEEANPLVVQRSLVSVAGTLIANGTSLSSASSGSSSDLKLKKDIVQLDEEESKNFISNLKPVSYKYINGNSNRDHHGFIAQDVKSAMQDRDWGLYIDNEGDKYLRYEELIADIVNVVQSQNREIEELKNIIKSLT